MNDSARIKTIELYLDAERRRVVAFELRDLSKYAKSNLRNQLLEIGHLKGLRHSGMTEGAWIAQARQVLAVSAGLRLMLGDRDIEIRGAKGFCSWLPGERAG